MGNESNFYTNGMPLWNQKFKTSASPGTNTPVRSTINSMEGLVCSDIVINYASMTMIIIKNNREMEFDISEIILIDTQANIMTIHSGDRAPFWLIFKTNAELVSVNTRLAAVMNSNVDPGC